MKDVVTAPRKDFVYCLGQRLNYVIPWGDEVLLKCGNSGVKVILRAVTLFEKEEAVQSMCGTLLCFRHK
jgi:hypothetical protein